MTKPNTPTMGQLKRKIERLEAQIEDMRMHFERTQTTVFDLIRDKVDYEMRVDHARRILEGEEA
jgi:hypothetical protein